MSISYHYQTDVVTLIRNYLQEHPECEDTVYGITQWWVKQQQFADSLTAVDNALSAMAVQGEISSVKRNNQTYYRLAKSN